MIILELLIAYFLGICLGIKLVSMYIAERYQINITLFSFIWYEIPKIIKEYYNKL